MTHNILLGVKTIDYSISDFQMELSNMIPMTNLSNTITRQNCSLDRDSESSSPHPQYLQSPQIIITNFTEDPGDCREVNETFYCTNC